MKFIATCLILIVSNVCYPQFDSILGHTFSIKSSISPDDEDFSDLQILKERIGNASVVMLGEQTHGDGATFEAKTRLVKFLHQEMGFDILAFEGEMYGLMKTEDAIKKGENHYSAFNRSLYYIWSDVNEFVPVMDYVKESLSTSNPLTIKGFDAQGGSIYMSDNFLKDLKEFLLKHNIRFDDSFFVPIEIYISELRDGDFKNYTSYDSLQFVNTCNDLVKKINSITPSQNKEEYLLWNRYLDNLLIDHQIEMNYQNNVLEIVQNSRDKAMAENLLFLKKLYPDKKIICWGASFHFAKSWNTIETNDTISKRYLDKISIDQSSPDYDIKEMSQAVVMGEYVANELKDDVYSIAFSSYSGSYSYGIGNKPVYEAPDGSIEKHLFNEGHNYAFVDLSKVEDMEKFYASPEGYIPFKANWEKMFDGIFFIKEMYPSTVMKRVDLEFEETKIENSQITISTNKFKGVLIDSKTKEPIAYAYVGLKSNSIATASNEDGYFELKIPKGLKTDTIQIQTIGYAKKVFSIKNSNSNTDTIRLNPTDNILKEVTITAKDLSPKKIVKKAINSIEKNYPQSPYGLSLYYNLKYLNDKDSAVLKNEAILGLYDEEGYKKSGWRHITSNKYLELLQFRSTNKKSELYDNQIWIYWAHDFVLTVDNPFSSLRMMGYTYKLEEIIPIDDSNIYKISFNCDKKNNYFTGWGSPDSLSGHLYINEKDNALVKYDYYMDTHWETKKGDSIRNKKSTSHTFRFYQGKYYPDVIKEEMIQDYYNSDKKKWFHTRSKEMILVTEINTENPKVLIKKMTKFDTDIPYNKEFWDNFNLIIDEKD